MKRLVLLLMSAVLVYGQEANAPRTTQELVSRAPAPLEIQGLDRAIQQLYASISGPAGKKRDPDAFRAMFVKEWGRLSVMGKDPQSGAMSVHILSPDDYIAKSFPYLEKNGFYEVEAARRTERFGDIVSVWSTYESRHNPGEAPFARGINAIQFVNDGGSWKILSLVWEGERPDLKLPQEYETSK